MRVPLLFLLEKPGGRRTLAFRIARRLNGRSSCERLILFPCTSAGILAKIPLQSQGELHVDCRQPWGRSSRNSLPSLSLGTVTSAAMSGTPAYEDERKLMCVDC